MALKEEFENTGNWLFRRRSYLPLILFVFAPLVIIIGGSHLENYPDVSFMAICFIVGIIGLIIRSLTIGFTPAATSGRNTSAGQVAETVNTKGIYSLIRHPLYMGNFFMWLGPILYVGNPWFVLVCILAYWLYYERIMFAEEAFLRRKFGKVYLEWAARTPVFFPAFKNYVNSNLDFSLRNVLKREYNGLLNLAISFVFVDIIKNYVYLDKLYLHPFWQITFAICLVIFLVLRTLRKTTRVLEVEGR
jgi:protein-S-isoprenylcysteine O-methyltransferase Ste14